MKLSLNSDSNCLAPRIKGIPQSLRRRCYSHLQTRCAKPPLSVLAEVSLSSTDRRSGRCLLPFSPLLIRYIHVAVFSDALLDGRGGKLLRLRADVSFEVLLILLSRCIWGTVFFPLSYIVFSNECLTQAWSKAR